MTKCIRQLVIIIQASDRLNLPEFRQAQDLSTPQFVETSFVYDDTNGIRRWAHVRKIQWDRFGSMEIVCTPGLPYQTVEVELDNYRAGRVIK